MLKKTVVDLYFNVSGFVGVYLAGYILELRYYEYYLGMEKSLQVLSPYNSSGSWSAVFNVTAVINICGIIVFSIFGSGNPIV